MESPIYAIQHDSSRRGRSRQRQPSPHRAQYVGIRADGRRAQCALATSRLDALIDQVIASGWRNILPEFIERKHVDISLLTAHYRLTFSRTLSSITFLDAH